MAEAARIGGGVVPVSCGVVVAWRDRLLLGQATGTKRWDIPKGLAEPGEDWETAARRELLEETSLMAPPGALRPLGRHAYLPRKDLVLFAWSPPDAPDPAALRCRSMVVRRDGRQVPELARFALVPWAELSTYAGRSLLAVLGRIGPAALGVAAGPNS